jgi:predicted ATPase/signal transduction histidine kinase
MRQLEREYALREFLHASWAAVPQAFVRHDDGVVLVMSDPGGQPLREACGAMWTQEAFLVVASGIVRAVEAMHAGGIVHLNLTPDNVLFDRISGRASLCGFGCAGLQGALLQTLSGKTSFAYTAPEVLGGLTAVAAPAADLYALGCLFYELLTGRSPFEGKDLLEWVHSHMARLPTPIDGVRPDLSPAVVRMVMRLLEKASETRHPDALALLADIAGCERVLGASHSPASPLVEAMPPSREDRSGRRHYGQRAHLAALEGVLGRVQANKAAQLVLVSGPSGIGKTSLIQVFRDTALSGQTIFAGNKSERVNQHVPFSALTEVLQGLLRPVLGANEDDFRAWRDVLKSALEGSGSVLCKLMPDLRTLLGEVVAPELNPRKEREALLNAAVDFIGAYCRRGRPVVLFFDDLQWTDGETLEVIRLLLHSAANSELLLIGAYRSGEWTELPSLMKALADPASLTTIALEPLQINDLARFVRERYRCSDTDANALADLLQAKTLGNPFFVEQFVSNLERSGFVATDWDGLGPRWDLAMLRARDFTDNVVEFLVQRLTALPAVTLPVLRILACVGARASMARLSIAAGLEPVEIHDALSHAVDLDCVRADGDAYAFWHDRIQEAVYATLSDTQRAAMHLDIARALSHSLHLDTADDAVFVAAGQANLAEAVIVSRAERRHFAQLNVAAAQKAMHVTAHGSALNYLHTASKLIDGDEDLDGFAHRVEFMIAECEFLTNLLDAAETRLAQLARADIDLVLLAEVTRVQAALYTTLDKPETAMQVGFDFLARIGIDIPWRPTDDDVRAAYDGFLLALNGRSPADLFDQPLLTDPLRKGTLNVLADLIPPALFVDVNLMDLLVLRMATESIEHGHSDSCCYAYVTVIWVSGIRFNDYALGYAFARLAIDLIERKGLQNYKARTHMGFGLYVLPWTGRLRDGLDYIREAFDAAMKTGDMTFAVYCRRNLASIMIVAGVPLADVRREALRALDFASAARFGLVIDAVRAQLALIDALVGLGGEQDVQGTDTALIEDFSAYADQNSHRTIAEFSFWVHRMQACMVFGDVAGALEAEVRAEPISWSSRSFVEMADFHFYAALAHAAALRNCGVAERAAHRLALSNHHRKLKNWAIHSPENFVGRAELVTAEMGRVSGVDAIQIGLSYDMAIAHAQEQGFSNDAALASEMAASFYAENGLTAIARGYLRGARSNYTIWGALAKVAALDKHPLLLGQRQPGTSHAGTDVGAQADARLQLDTLAVVRASNALSSEIMPERVVETLMATALAMSGAQSGALLLNTAQGLSVAASAVVQDGGVQVDVLARPVDAGILPLSLIQTVSRTFHTIVLDDASLDHTFSRDPCFQARHPRSIFCMPLIKQSRLIGILYLENNLAAGAFVPARTSVLEVLASQAAIALDNARLYDELLNENRQRITAEEALRHAQADFERAARLITMGELVASIVHEVTQPINAIGTSAGAALRWLNREVPDLDESRQMLEQIVSDSARAKSVVHGLREMAKKSVPTMALFDLPAAISEVLALARAHLHDVSVELDDGLAAGAGEAFGDRVQIQQVTLNLIMNALEAMSEVTDRERVLRIRCRRSVLGTIEVFVEDNGRGLDTGSLNKIFEPFFTTKQNGMGMGLAICQSIIQAHGGQLGVTSAGEHGTIVWFSLPIAAEPDAAILLDGSTLASSS